MSMATDTSQVPSQIMHPNRNKEQDYTTGDEGSNRLFIIQGKIAIQAVEDKIVILTDKFRSGYECKDCGETGVLQQCVCESAGRAGLNRLGGVCSTCSGSPGDMHGKACPFCKGTGQTIVIPESTKSMPTTGIIVSAGPLCCKRSVGERVLFGAHTGYFIPFKGNVRVRIMREEEPLCLMFAIDPSATMEDFQLLQEPIDNTSALK